MAIDLYPMPELTDGGATAVVVAKPGKVPRPSVPGRSASKPAAEPTTPTPYAGSLPTPTNFDPIRSPLPVLPCLRRWTADEVIQKLHTPIEEMRRRRNLPPLTDEERAQIVGEYVLMPMACSKLGATNHAQAVSPPAGQGRGGPGEGGVTDTKPLKPIPICGSLAYWLDPYGRWHCCECDPWKVRSVCRGYHVVDRVPVGGGCGWDASAAKPFLVMVDDPGYRDEESGGPLEMVVSCVDLGWALRE